MGFSLFPGEHLILLLVLLQQMPCQICIFPLIAVNGVYVLIAIQLSRAKSSLALLPELLLLHLDVDHIHEHDTAYQSCEPGCHRQHTSNPPLVAA